MVVRLNGRLWTEIGVAAAAAMSPPASKRTRIRIGTYMRLYPGVDAMATQRPALWCHRPKSGKTFGNQFGLQHHSRVRQQCRRHNVSNGGLALTCGQTLYVRRAFAYLAGANWGLIRMGQTDGVTGIFDNGITTGQQAGQGLWNGDAPSWRRRCWFGDLSRGSRSRALTTVPTRSSTCRHNSLALTWLRLGGQQRQPGERWFHGLLG